MQIPDPLASAWRRWSPLHPASAFFVPGRVELLGKHTDYGGGRSLLCAVDRGFSVLAAPRPDRRIRLLDAASGQQHEFLPEDPAPTNWSRYCAAVARRLAADGRLPHGADIAFISNLPPAAGMSSSSAFVIASYLALTGDLPGDRSRGLGLRGPQSGASTSGPCGEAAQGPAPSDVEELAAYLAAAEVGVGTHGGSEDHTAILCCQPGHWSQFRFRPTRAEAVVPAPGALSLVIAVSGVTASKAGSERAAYNRASAALADILARWNEISGRNDASLGAALASDPAAHARLRAALPPPLQLRLDQFYNECEVWIPAAVAAARAGNWSAFGDSIAASQAAAEHALGNQTPETVALVSLARRHGSLAASSFGAGFGGSVWALAPRPAGAFARAWIAAYRAQFAEHAAASLCFESTAGAPATRLPWTT